jgi:ABC-type transport system substrate-binding protein
MAFAMAIDRERLNEIVNEGKGTIAKGIYPPGLPGYNPGVAPIPHDPEEARRVLRQSSYPTVKDLPEITFTTSGAGSDLYSRDALVLQMWEEVLGVSVKVEQLDSKTFYQEVISGNHGNLISLGWCADYLDPENFADVLFHSERQQNVGGYRDDELDAQLAAARSEEDIDTRISLYQDIEQHIVYDVPAIFLNHSRTWYIVQKPYVQGYVSSPIEVAQNMNIWIAHEK